MTVDELVRLNSQDALLATIPTALTTFVGRERELTDVGRLLASSRLVTLTGTAGCGKTRLALRIAAEAIRHHPDGVYWVELARIMDSDLIPQAVARVLGVVEQPGRPTVEGLLDSLLEKQILLVLDNCEHVLDVGAQLVEALLTGTGVHVLATSREPLSVIGEMRYPVPPMALPQPNLPAGEMGRFDAIQLFVERARAILPAFALTPKNAGVVASICHQLDGMPLAIELASARVNVLTVEQIAARLDDRFGLLGAPSHVAQSQHRTLRAAIDWSYDLLSPPEQATLRRLSVFAGGCSLAIAEIVCAGDGVERERVVELLSALVDKSLVVAQTLQRDEARYSLLETIRQYAREKLFTSGELSVLRDRHLQCFLRVAEETEPKLSGKDQPFWLNWLEEEHPNIRAALTWSLEGHHIEEALRIVDALYQYWTIRDYVQEGLDWLDRLLGQADEHVSPVIRAQSLAYAAFLASFRGKTSEQMRYAREAAGLAEAAGDQGKPALVWALGALAHGARAAGDFESEFAIAKRVIQLRRELGDPYFLGLALSLYSPTALAVGKYREAHDMLDEAVPLLRAVGNPYRIAMALNYSGDLARCEKNFARAQVDYEASVSLLREVGATRDLASVLHNCGHACLHLGDVERAQTLFHESLALQQSQGNTPGAAECLIGFAALAVERELPGPAARLLAAAEAIGGPRIASAWVATRSEYEHYLARARAMLTEVEFETEQAAGRAFSIQQAAEYAEYLTLKRTATPAIGKKPDNLTVREREVVGLIALGKSNGEIANELVVSKRTVEKHIANILSKRQVTNRAQIVRWALERGLVKASE